MRSTAALAGVALPLILAACSGEDEGLVLRPGDGLLDLAPLARQVQRAESNLPPGLREAAAADAIRLRTPTMLHGAWRPVEKVPDEYAALMEQYGYAQLWQSRQPVASLAGHPAPQVWVEGLPADAEAILAEGPLVWWDRPSSSLLAAGNRLPREVALDVWVDPAAEFGDVEPGLLDEDGSSGATTTAVPVGRHQLGDTSRRALMLPAPSRWDLSVDGLDAERLEVSVGLLDRGWIQRDATTFRARQQGDGVTFAVEVSRPGEPARRLWSRHVGPEQAGESFIDAEVDLTSVGDGPLVISLVTEPGPDGDSDFDYALWGGLRLRGAPSRPPRRPHIVLIDIDTLRGDRVGPDADGHSLTPGLDAWAAERAVTFADAASTASWTLPATISMLTGLAVHQHGVERATGALGPGVPTLAELLAAHGYETRGVAAGGYLRPAFGLDRGFEVYRTTEPTNLDWGPELQALARHDSERPLFLFVHTYFVHAPYRHDPAAAPADYHGPLAGQDVDYDNVIDPFRAGTLELSEADQGYIAALYDGLVRQMDAALAPFLEGLHAALGDEPVAVVLTSDHGEAFFEHDLLGHGLAVWNELLAVPLLVAFPDGSGAGTTRHDPVGLLDVVPTLLSLAEVPVPEDLPGQDLAGTLPANRVRVARHSQADRLRTVLDSGYKLIETRVGEVGDGEPRLELFHLERDPDERRPLGDEARRQIGTLLHRLERFEERWPVHAGGPAAGGAMTDEVREQLRALGYLGDDADH